LVIAINFPVSKTTQRTSQCFVKILYLHVRLTSKQVMTAEVMCY